MEHPCAVLGRLAQVQLEEVEFVVQLAHIMSMDLIYALHVQLVPQVLLVRQYVTHAQRDTS